MSRKRLLAIVGPVLALLILSASSILGVVDLSQLSFSTASTQVESSSTPTVFVDPDLIVKDYVNDPGYQVGDAFSLSLDISNATDLFAWQISITWDPAILNFSRVVEYGTFLRATASPNGTSGWIDRDPTQNVTIAPFNNTLGTATIAETILGDYVGIGGDGRLVTVEFEIVGYGWTYLNVSLTGDLATTLLDSVGTSTAFDRQFVAIFPSDSYFRSVITGDMTDDTPGIPPDLPDGDVDPYDLGAFADAYGKSFGHPAYDHLGDLTDDTPGILPDLPDGDVDPYDLGVFADNYGRP